MALRCTNSMSDGGSVHQSPLLGIIFLANDLTGLSPFEIIRVEKGVDHDDDVHEGREEEVEEEADKILGTLHHVAGKPEADAEGIELESVSYKER